MGLSVLHEIKGGRRERQARVFKNVGVALGYDGVGWDISP